MKAKELIQQVRERELTDKELKRREEIADDLPDAEFKKRYGAAWKGIKMATATNMAKKEEVVKEAVRTRVVVFRYQNDKVTTGIVTKTFAGKTLDKVEYFLDNLFVGYDDAEKFIKKLKSKYPRRSYGTLSYPNVKQYFNKEFDKNKRDYRKESVDLEEGGEGSGPQDGDKRGTYDTDGPSSKDDKVSNVKSFGKNIKGVSSVRQDGNRLEFDTSDGTATAREILKKFGKSRVKVDSMPDDDDPEMSATVVVTLRKESVQEADLTDKQVDMVKKVADKLPMKDFKKRYGKDAENVKFGTATNIVKKKLNIDHYEGARKLVDRLVKDINSKDGDKE